MSTSYLYYLKVLTNRFADNMFKCIAVSLLCFGINRLDWFITKKEKVYNGRVVMKKGWFKWNVTELPEPTCKLITYIYNSRKYLYVAYDDMFTWPPEPVKGPSFNMAIKSAKDMKTGDDHTEYVKRLAGPRGDFHGVKVRVGDIFGDKTLEVENILGIKTTLHPSSFF